MYKVSSEVGIIKIVLEERGNLADYLDKAVHATAGRLTSAEHTSIEQSIRSLRISISGCSARTSRGIRAMLVAG